MLCVWPLAAAAAVATDADADVSAATCIVSYRFVPYDIVTLSPAAAEAAAAAVLWYSWAEVATSSHPARLLREKSAATYGVTRQFMTSCVSNCSQTDGQKLRTAGEVV